MINNQSPYQPRQLFNRRLHSNSVNENDKDELNSSNNNNITNTNNNSNTNSDNKNSNINKNSSGNVLTLNDISSNNIKKENLNNSNRNINSVNNHSNSLNFNLINNNNYNNSNTFKDFQDDDLFKRKPNPNQSQPSTITKKSSKNVLKSESFPMIPSNWENSKYPSYLKFRSYYVTLKSKKYILMNLSFLVGSFLSYYSIYYYDFHKGNQFVFYLSIIITTLFFSFSVHNIYLHFEKVPELQMTEEERVLYGWPANFPSSPNSHLSPIKPKQQQPINNTSTPLKSNLDQLNSISPIQKNLQPLDGFISSYSSYDQFMKARELASSTYTPGASQFGRVSTNNNNNKSFDDMERERMNYNFQGRLQTSLTDFSFERKGKDLLDAVNSSNVSFNAISGAGDDNDEKEGDISSNSDGKVDGGRVELINEERPTYYQSYSGTPYFVQKPVVQEIIVKPKTFEQVIENKNSFWKRYIEDNHFYNIVSCSSKCKRWFTINIISQLVQPAQTFLQLKEDLQFQHIQEEQSKPFTKLQYEQMSTPLELMKSVLKNVQYNLNSINDVHHKREPAYICQRIIELSSDKFVFQEFGRGGQNWMDQYPTDEQLLFCLFCAYMDNKLYRDITAPNPDIPFSSKYIKFQESKYLNPNSPMFSIAFKRPLHVDILLSDYSQTIEISPGFDNLFYAIVLFFYNIIKNQNGYLEGFNVDLLQVAPFLQPLLNTNTFVSNSDDEDEFY
ncbi:hypothetical protein DICPUDRAFT_77644 [Dictyostelium purpureum]|uniref:Transmembrane protein 209 n=1 Tax=Dictyostelium purpureum TaxID=5786 RepID=F0ZH81_DICPU|nr:uncharacterized protein DICPUDRAFT_77644 [Dictyostelium purpureum]EGC36676.1 hypothetical protein DICPUDRAFT_77644 [Dictyostelium purpureum]|eukprot:XP_003286775.1 hypothetical protein DICPUDRAFT_77644 [Dictyostelium purpureum]